MFYSFSHLLHWSFSPFTGSISKNKITLNFLELSANLSGTEVEAVKYDNSHLKCASPTISNILRSYEHT